MSFNSKGQESKGKDQTHEGGHKSDPNKRQMEAANHVLMLVA